MTRCSGRRSHGIRGRRPFLTLTLRLPHRFRSSPSNFVTMLRSLPEASGPEVEWKQGQCQVLALGADGTQCFKEGHMACCVLSRDRDANRSKRLSRRRSQLVGGRAGRSTRCPDGVAGALSRHRHGCLVSSGRPEKPHVRLATHDGRRIKHCISKSGESSARRPSAAPGSSSVFDDATPVVCRT